MQDLDTIVAECKASQNKEELKWLIGLVREIKPQVVLEIGSWRGYLLDTWAKALTTTTDVIGVELDRVNVDMECIAGNKKISCIEGDSHSLELELQIRKFLDMIKKPVDFLFIDGDHTYDSVCRDFEIYSKYVRKGGIVAFHDASLVGHPLVHVHMWWDKYHKDYNSVRFTGKAPDGHLEGTGTGVIYL